MSGERYGELALVALRDALVTGIPAQLSVLEAAQGLTAGSIPLPVDTVIGRVPYDNRAPLIAVFVEGLSPQVQRNRVLHTECQVAIQLIAASADQAGLEQLELTGLRYFTALLEAIRVDASLGGRSAGATVDSGDVAAAISGEGDRSSTKLVLLSTITVRTQS